MAKKFGKFLLFTAAASAVGAAAYCYMKKKDAELMAELDEDYDDFSEDMDIDSSRNYVPLTQDNGTSVADAAEDLVEDFVVDFEDAPVETPVEEPVDAPAEDAFTPLTEKVAEVAEDVTEEVEETIEEFFDEDDEDSFED